MLKEWTSRLTESAVTVKVLCLYTDNEKEKGGQGAKGTSRNGQSPERKDSGWK